MTLQWILGINYMSSVLNFPLQFIIQIFNGY